MSGTNDCCVGAYSGMYFGEDIQQLTKKKIRMKLFAPESTNAGVLNTIDLTQSDFGTYFKDLLTTATDIDQRLMSTGFLNEHKATRSEYGSWTSPTGEKYTDKSTGGVYSHEINWTGSSASFIKMQQAKGLNCGKRRVIEVDQDRTIWVYKATDQATTATGYPMHGDSVDDYYTYAEGTTPGTVTIKYDYTQETDVACSYGIPACVHGLSWDDLKALNAGFLNIDSVTSVSEIVVSAYYSVGKAMNNASYTGLTNAADWTITDSTTGLEVTAAPVESPTGTYTIGLTPSLTAASEFTVEAAAGTYVFESQTGETT